MTLLLDVSFRIVMFILFAAMSVWVLAFAGMFLWDAGRMLRGEPTRLLGLAFPSEAKAIHQGPREQAVADQAEHGGDDRKRVGQ